MLTAEQITKCYGRGRRATVAIDRLSLSLAPGERLGLVGPSGTGKSTLAQVMALLLRPEHGRVVIDGVASPGWGVRAPRDLRLSTQLVWQSPRTAVDPRLRLREVVLEPLAASRRLPRDSARVVDRWAERVGITSELLDRYPHEVSEGQLQRACLARALIVEPRYLLCDEMTSMLDVSTQAALLASISDVQRDRELGVLLITHDRILADHWCGSVVDIATLARAADASAPAHPVEHQAKHRAELH